MTIGERIEQRRKAINIPSQSALARKAGVGQSTLNGIIRKPYRWSPYLVPIARALNTTVEYLTGATDDPDANVPPTAQVHDGQLVMMPVILPNENALADMFEGLLLAIDREQPVDEIARELAQLLPTGLSQLQGRLIELPRPPRTRSAETSAAPREDAEVLATADRGQPR